MSELGRCSNGCCWQAASGAWFPRGAMLDPRIAIEREFCPKTGERLLLNGKTEPRLSGEYVRLLEAAARDIRTRWYTEWAIEVLPASCYQRITHHGPIPCAHDDPPIGCLKALAAEREKEQA